MANSLVLLTKRAKALTDPLPCRREDSRLWFSDLPIDLQLAKAHCRSCPVRSSCLAGAVERHEPHGVWGGEIFTRGVIIPEKRPRGRPRRKTEAVIRVEAAALQGRAAAGLPGTEWSGAGESGTVIGYHSLGSGRK